jgi:hypothetical protein
MARRALLVGTEHYEDGRTWSTLASAGVDLQELATVLEDRRLGAYELSEPLLDRPSDRVRKEVEKFFRSGAEDDELLFYLTGHGSRLHGKLLWPLIDTDVDAPDATALNAADLRRWIEDCRAGEIVVILDSCHAGGLRGEFIKPVSKAGSVLFRDALALSRPPGAAPSRDFLFATGTDDDAYVAAPRIGSPVAAARSAFTDAIATGISTGAAANGAGRVTGDSLFDYVQRALDAAGTEHNQRPDRLFYGSSSPVISGSPGRPLDGAAASVELGRVPDEGGGGLTVAGCDERTLGAATPRVAVGEYIPRLAIDRQLAAGMRTAEIVLAVGPPRSGRATALYEAAATVWPEATIIPLRFADELDVLPVPDELPTDDMPVVLWLQNAHEFLWPGGLSVELLDRWRRAGRRLLVLGRTRREELDRISAAGLHAHVAGQLLARAVQVEVPAEFDPVSYRLAKARIRDANVTKRIGEYQAGIENLRRRWAEPRDDDAAMLAVVRAAARVRRCGLRRPLSGSELAALAGRDLAVRLDGPAVQVLATSARHAGFLDWTNRGGLAFDAEESACELDEHDDPAGPSLAWWEALIDRAGPWDALSVGFSAYCRGMPSVAERVWSKSVDHGENPEAAFHHGLLLIQQDRWYEARGSLQTAFDDGAGAVRAAAAFLLAQIDLRDIDSGSVDSGSVDSGAVDHIGRKLATAVDFGAAPWAARAAVSLGALLRRANRFDECQRVLAAATGVPDPVAASWAWYELGRCNEERLRHVRKGGDPEFERIALARAEGCFRQATGTVGPARLAAYRLALLLIAAGEADEGERLLTTALAERAAARDELDLITYRPPEPGGWAEAEYLLSWLADPDVDAADWRVRLSGHRPSGSPPGLDHLRRSFDAGSDRWRSRLILPLVRRYVLAGDHGAAVDPVWSATRSSPAGGPSIHMPSPPPRELSLLRAIALDRSGDPNGAIAHLNARQEGASPEELNLLTALLERQLTVLSGSDLDRARTTYLALTDRRLPLIRPTARGQLQRRRAKALMAAADAAARRGDTLRTLLLYGTAHRDLEAVAALGLAESDGTEPLLCVLRVAIATADEHAYGLAACRSAADGLALLGSRATAAERQDSVATAAAALVDYLGGLVRSAAAQASTADAGTELLAPVGEAAAPYLPFDALVRLGREVTERCVPAAPNASDRLRFLRVAETFLRTALAAGPDVTEPDWARSALVAVLQKELAADPDDGPDIRGRLRTELWLLCGSDEPATRVRARWDLAKLLRPGDDDAMAVAIYRATIADAAASPLDVVRARHRLLRLYHGRPANRAAIVELLRMALSRYWLYRWAARAALLRIARWPRRAVVVVPSVHEMSRHRKADAAWRARVRPAAAALAALCVSSAAFDLAVFGIARALGPHGDQLLRFAAADGVLAVGLGLAALILGLRRRAGPSPLITGAALTVAAAVAGWVLLGGFSPLHLIGLPVIAVFAGVVWTLRQKGG